jgi:hypothetical protein
MKLTAFNVLKSRVHGDVPLPSALTAWYVVILRHVFCARPVRELHPSYHILGMFTSSV